MPLFMRTSIYIDGFNFYYGAVKDTPYKWLNFKSLFATLLNDKYQIVEIKYFTALVSGLRDPRQPIRQKTFLRALGLHPGNIYLLWTFLESQSEHAFG